MRTVAPSASHVRVMGECQTAEIRGLKALVPMSAWAGYASHRSQHSRSTREARKHENRCHFTSPLIGCEWHHATRHWLINKYAISHCRCEPEFRCRRATPFPMTLTPRLARPLTFSRRHAKLCGGTLWLGMVLQWIDLSADTFGFIFVSGVDTYEVGGSPGLIGPIAQFGLADMRNHDSVIDGWEVLTEDEAIDAAIDKYRKDPTTSVAYCTFAADDGRKGPEYRFWFDLFLKLSKADHVGWA